MEKTTDLLRDTYYLLQSYTTKTPGPSLKSKLKRAGIEEIPAPSQEEINERIGIVKENTPLERFNQASLPLVEPMVGGDIRDELKKMKFSIFAFMLIAILLAADANLHGDGNTIGFLKDAFVNLSITGLISALWAKTGEVGREVQREKNREQLELHQRWVERYEREERERLELILDEEAVGWEAVRRKFHRDEHDNTKWIFELYNRPMMGELEIELEYQNGELSTLKVDPISQATFEDGEIVAVLEGKTQQPYKLQGLEAWFAMRKANGLPFTHPSGRNVISKQDVTLYKIKLGSVKSEGGTRKTRKTKKKSRKFSKT